jgi:putative pyruvate formate lyase activating enzyme
MWKILRPESTFVFDDPLVKKSLDRYIDVANNCKLAKFKVSKKTPATFDESFSLAMLWEEQDRCKEKFCNLEQEFDKTNFSESCISLEKSYFDLKLEIAGRIVQKCGFCVRKCGVDRTAGNVGYCGCGDTMAVSSIFMHTGEEPELVPSGTIFTMGCTIRCSHCQNWTISQWAEESQRYTPIALAVEIDQLRLGGSRNVNLVGGEPTPWLQQWLQTFQHVKENVPIVWNSNSYYSPETAQLLAGFADVYLLDFKYGPGNCAEEISQAPNYWNVCTGNHLEAKKEGELIVRVLVLPGHLECCTKPILEWIAKNLGSETRINIMFQYRPEWHANEFPELRRTLTKDETEQAIQMAKMAGLTNFIT